MKVSVEIEVEEDEWDTLSKKAQAKFSTASADLRKGCKKALEQPQLFVKVLSGVLDAEPEPSPSRKTSLALDMEDITKLDYYAGLTGITRRKLISLALTGLVKGVIKI